MKFKKGDLVRAVPGSFGGLERGLAVIIRTTRGMGPLGLAYLTYFYESGRKRWAEDFDIELVHTNEI